MKKKIIIVSSFMMVLVLTITSVFASIISTEDTTATSEENIAYTIEQYLDSDAEDPYIHDLEHYYTEALSEMIPQESTIEVPMYDMETVNKIIDAYLASDAQGNEDFFDYLSLAYQVEPDMIDAIIMQYSDANVELMASGLAEVYKTKGIMLDESSIIGFIPQQISDILPSAIQNISTPSDITAYSSYVPTIASFVYTETIEVGQSVPLSIKLQESNGTHATRAYTVKVFCTRDGREHQLASTTMTIPSGSTTATKSVNLSFSNAGTFTTRIAVYDGSTLLTTRSGGSPDISHRKLL